MTDVRTIISNPSFAMGSQRLLGEGMESEAAVLGSIISYGELAASCGLLEGDFYSARHQAIYGAIKHLFDSGIHVDITTVHDRLKIQGLLEVSGGFEYLSALCDSVFSKVGFDSYVANVKNAAVGRRGLEKVAQAIPAVVSAPDPRCEIAALSKALAELSVDGAGNQLSTEDDVLSDLEGFNEKFSRVKTPLGMTMDGGQMIVLAGRPGTGKTSLGWQIAQGVSASVGMTLFCCGEMQKQELWLRGICQMVGTSVNPYAKSFEEHKRAYASYVKEKMTIRLNTDARPDVDDIVIQARSLPGLKLLVVDYLQRLRCRRAAKEGAFAEVSEIAITLKSLAQELGIPVLALAQLSRNSVESGKERRPVPTDLRASGQIEQEADQIWLLYNEEPTEDDGQMIELITAKCRNGKPGSRMLEFYRPAYAFRSTL